MTDISDAELDAYIDGELCARRRLAVEAYLADNPEAAARVMADLRFRTALQIAALRIGPEPVATIDLANHLTRRLTRFRLRDRLPATGRWSAVAAAVVLVQLGFASVGPVKAALPEYVEDAEASYRTGLLRALMASQVESVNFDRSEIRSRLKIEIPRLPAGWKITDVQVFPSDDGPALQLMIRTYEGEDLSIFAVRAATRAPASPVAVRQGASSVAFWRRGSVSYALTGVDDPHVLDRIATQLASQPAD